jgi:hypothetical protein
MVSNNGASETIDEMELFEDQQLNTELTDEAYEELAGLEGSVVIGVSFWDSSLADETEEEEVAPEQRMLIDLDMYLEDNVALELYGAALYTSPESEPLVGMPALEQALMAMVDQESVLDEVAETDDGGLVLVFAADGEITLLISVGAWTVSEWDELPED